MTPEEHSDTIESQWRRDELNEALHRMAKAEPCETACTHKIAAGWTLLGLANLAARVR